jgi:hypothetical protein
MPISQLRTFRERATALTDGGDPCTRRERSDEECCDK